MHLKNLLVENFRAIRVASLRDLQMMVVIAGPNGCGKSTLFDAIRLIKSVYGGYQQNEWQHWFSEFQINLDRRQPEVLGLLQDKNSPLHIAIDIVLSDEERRFLRENLPDLLRPAIWSQVVPDSGSSPYRSGVPIAAQLRQYGDEVEDKVVKEVDAIKMLLDDDCFHGELTIPPDLRPGIGVEPSPVLQLVFSLYEPQNIGIIDFHGPQRTYQREQIGGVNLRLDPPDQRSSKHALYNYTNKYTNIKSEMASNVVRELLAREAGAQFDASSSLFESLKELFATFFPGKTFTGTQPTREGALLFPVVTDAGLSHDLNDLSSGEKEVLYGYLRLFNLSPKHSILLIDEPELHLNPRLVQGLPQFYQKYLGKPLDNQIWLLTHSDALLREAIETDGAGVFHMLLPDLSEEGNQIKPIAAEDEIERAIISLVGDVATYKPGAKVVIFEGGGVSEYDVEMVTALFPGFAKQVNLISGGNKAMVGQLHEILSRVKNAGVLAVEVFSIVDRDSDSLLDELHTIPNSITWDVYHIENYLLEPKYIHKVLQNASGKQSSLKTHEEVEVALRDSAEKVLPFILRHVLQQEVNKKFLSSLDFGTDPNAIDLSTELRASIERTFERISNEVDSSFMLDSLKQREAELHSTLGQDLESGSWRKSFRGRDILRRFTGEFCPGMRYAQFRNLVLSAMREDGYQPEGMKKTIDLVWTD